MRITTDDGVGLAVEELGSGPPFLMVHGFTGAKEDFADHAPRFAEHSRVVLFDHRGHGASDKPDDADRYTLDRLVADTLAVADDLGLAQFTLLGHSMGGMVARRLVLAHPERVHSLVLMDTSPGMPPSIDPELAGFAADVALSDGMAVLREILDEADTLGSDADKRVRRERPGYEEFNARKWADVAPAAYAGLLRSMIHQPDQIAQMHTITCPTLVVVGEADQHFVPAARAMVDALPDARLVVVPDAGHSPQFESPDAYFAAIDGFLRRTSDRGAGVGWLRRPTPVETEPAESTMKPGIPVRSE
jgi:pimeloyl-ACP methyl ester carboxylesterase